MIDEMDPNMGMWIQAFVAYVSSVYAPPDHAEY